MKFNMHCTQVEPTSENILLLKALRFKAYEPHCSSRFKPFDLQTITPYEIFISEGIMLPFALYIDNQMVAGCYISISDETLYIEQLFVHPELQGKKLQLGRLLLKYVLLQKETIEEYFKTKLEESILDPISKKVGSLYEEIGYQYSEQNECMKKKL